jgi:hypothetical protein
MRREVELFKEFELRDLALKKQDLKLWMAPAPPNVLEKGHRAIHYTSQFIWFEPRNPQFP